MSNEWEDYYWEGDLGVFAQDELGLNTWTVPQPLAKHVPNDYDTARNRYWQELTTWLHEQA